MTDELLTFEPQPPKTEWNSLQDAIVSVALRTPKDEWQWCGRAILTVGCRRLDGWADIKADDGIAWFAPHDRTLLDELRILSGKRARLISPAHSRARWHIDKATITKNQLSPFADRLRLRFRKVAFEMPAPDQQASIIRIVYRGLKLPRHMYQVYVHDRTGARLFGFSFLEAMNRRFIISEIERSDDAKKSYTALTFAAPELSQLDLDAVELTLYYVAGSGAIRQVEELYDSEGRWFRRSYHRHGHAQAELPRPLFQNDEYREPKTFKAIGGMVDEARRLIQRGFPLRAILFHLFSAQQRVPEIKLTHLAVALDAIKTALIVKIRGEGKLIADDKEFSSRIAPALEALDAEFKDPKDATTLTLIKRRLESANDWSERERWKRFWRDVIKYELSTEERRVLDHRDVAIHVGYILKTEYDLENDDSTELDRRPYETRLRELDYDANVFRNVVDRVLLAVLGYRGHFVDGTDSTRVVDMHSA